MIEQALFTYLSTYAGLTALVGTRVYPLRPPQNATKPYVTYAKVSSPTVDTFQTTLGESTRFDFTCTADDYATAKSVKAQVQAALQGYTGTVGGVDIRMALKQNELDAHDDQTKLFHVVMDFIIWHSGG